MSQKGFTLVEVMVAMAITAVASVMAYYGIDSAINLSRAAEVEADYLRQTNRAFDILSRDFRHVIGRQVREPYGYNKEHAFMLDKDGERILKFSRIGWTNPEPARFQRSQLQRVEYHLDGEKLIRSSWQMMDRYDDSKTQEIVLLDKVKSFAVKVMQQPDISQMNQLGSNVFINIKPTSDDGWLEKWPANENLDSFTATSALPMAVEITVELERWGEVRRVFELVTNGVESM